MQSHQKRWQSDGYLLQEQKTQTNTRLSDWPLPVSAEFLKFPQSKSERRENNSIAKISKIRAQFEQKNKSKK